MSGDPAVDAAQRAEQASKWWARPEMPPWYPGYAIDAAREALKPLRAFHFPEFDPDDPEHYACFTCVTQWPCNTAKLIYPAKELES